MIFPARVEPVKAMTRICGSSTTAAPTSAPPGSMWNTPGGQPGLLEDPGEHHAAAHRGARVGLEHHRVAQRQRGGDRPDRQDDRGVERRDHPDHADRQPARHRQPRLVRAQQLAVRVRWPARRPPSTPRRPPRGSGTPRTAGSRRTRGPASRGSRPRARRTAGRPAAAPPRAGRRAAPPTPAAPAPRTRPPCARRPRSRRRPGRASCRSPARRRRTRRPTPRPSRAR